MVRRLTFNGESSISLVLPTESFGRRRLVDRIADLQSVEGSSILHTLRQTAGALNVRVECQDGVICLRAVRS